MIIDVIVSSFQKMWDKIGTSFISSVIAAVNPFFFFLNLAMIKLFNRNFMDWNANPAAYIVMMTVFMACSGVFPTTFLGIAMNKRIAENELIYVKHYFGDIPKAFKATIIPSLILTVAYGAAAYLISSGALFYFRFMTNNSLKGFLIVILIMSFVFIMLMQYILIPYVIYRKKINYLKALRFSASMIMAEFPAVLAVFLVDAFFFFLFAWLNGASLFIYYLISSYFRIYLYGELVMKYPKFRPED